MCVILLAHARPLSEEDVRAAYEANKFGAGVAWREDGKVRWEKGLHDPDDLAKLVKKLSLPYVVHCRVPTCGDDINGLTHPFPVTLDVPLDLTGKTDGYVLFHNGHWTAWREFVLRTITAMYGQIKLPPGGWSDSRAMAWAASVYGLGILELIDEKAIAFGPQDIHIFRPRFWETVEDGILASNTTWKVTAKPIWPAPNRSTVPALIEKPGGASPNRPFQLMEAIELRRQGKLGTRAFRRATNLFMTQWMTRTQKAGPASSTVNGITVPIVAT